MREVGLTDIRKSIQNRKNTVAQYIVTRLLLNLCEGARAREGAKVTITTKFMLLLWINYIL